MAQNPNKSIPRDQFLTIAVNLLYKAFLENRRTEAKNVFRDMATGRTVHLTNVVMEDKSQVRFDVALDHSEYRGKLNFGAFRASLAMLVAQLSDALRAGKDIKVFSEQNNPDNVVFGLSAATEDEGEVNVMVLGADSNAARGSIELRLQYLDPAQFAAEAQATPAGG
ncbi:MAG TPA: hypothetical protein DD808_00835 [Halieaceae bacterium]|jgi:hypothetical protein|uniref:hypothetical protein n=1 Tax=Haliea TaxID=475794 RepID=UPI000C4241A2|nr:MULTISPECIES: hypothetical protein [Haliea]MCR9184419.1 hypothetical protein [Halieaceae bacterium]MAY94628.1 hypothetical protein [Haliea sp.]MBP71632.1 hypothetical protein [Haliea sp.]HAN68746.1 hypothetical protein [Halieaceae bacterium]HBM83065.1 hypothetical protein [Halieaceae bacterium]|tara:strand:- start:53552 stop:54052 length:501 start_codon:yes stop_codon:yes gene_type:complete